MCVVVRLCVVGFRVVVLAIVFLMRSDGAALRCGALVYAVRWSMCAPPPRNPRGAMQNNTQKRPPHHHNAAHSPNTNTTTETRVDSTDLRRPARVVVVGHVAARRLEAGLAPQVGRDEELRVGEVRGRPWF